MHPVCPIGVCLTLCMHPCILRLILWDSLTACVTVTSKQERRCRRCNFFILSNQYTAKQIISSLLVKEMKCAVHSFQCNNDFCFPFPISRRSFVISESRISDIRQILLPDDFTMPFKQVPDYRLLGNLHAIMPLVLYRKRAWL